MRRDDDFGWDLPPGTNDQDIDDAFEGEDRDWEDERGEAEDRAMDREERRRERGR